MILTLLVKIWVIDFTKLGLTEPEQSLLHCHVLDYSGSSTILHLCDTEWMLTSKDYDFIFSSSAHIRYF